MIIAFVTGFALTVVLGLRERNKQNIKATA